MVDNFVLSSIKQTFESDILILYVIKNINVEGFYKYLFYLWIVKEEKQ